MSKESTRKIVKEQTAIFADGSNVNGEGDTETRWAKKDFHSIFLVFFSPNTYRWYWSTSSDSDYDDITNNHDAIQCVDSTNISPSITKRRVNFIPKKNSNINGKSSSPTSPTSPTATPLSPGTKMRRRRLRTTSRSGDDRISFRGRKPIYTAGNIRLRKFCHSLSLRLSNWRTSCMV